MKRLCGLGLCLIALPIGLEHARAQAPVNFREVFLELDTNGDRVIELSEVPDDGRQAFKRLLKKADSNDDGKLEADEFRALGEQLRDSLGNNAVGSARAEALRKRLRKMDENGDGKIQRSEFDGPPALFDQLDRDNDGVLTSKDRSDDAPAPRPSTLPARVRRLDRDGDGKIERKEFPGRSAVFSQLDKNGDGVLSPQELRNGQSKLSKAAKAAKKP
jgi:Ca2+-binding EF-hand superfamily protein